MTPEMQGALIAIGTLVGLGVIAVFVKTLLDIGRAARVTSDFIDDANQLVPDVRRAIARSEMLIARLEDTAGQIETISRSAKEEVQDLLGGIDELRDNGRRVSAVIQGAKAGIDAFRSSREG
ncbi:MAG: hypothetical protein KDA27_07035 [Candidatus Eisenbacteria bacterium]|uniref:DUF948 domain-containing protein n=1 Tax=Eiseniibacteriota bacterium TaxID=2212470 RepID=A0A956SDR5_UNCEI|nr:hypothetical protein [Candidatus Eisenbacteria bacterium]